jgi:hypothetical protein
MKKLLIIKLVFCVMLLTAIQSCKDDCQDSRNPDCENYSPCVDAQPTSAYFIIEEVLYGSQTGGIMPSDHTIKYETDTVISGQDVLLTCNQKTDSIWWILDDSEMREAWQQQKSFTIKFATQGKPLTVKVTCVVKNNKPSKCIINDNGMDTFTRYIRVMPALDRNPSFIGTFQGNLLSKPDSTFIVTFKFDSVNNKGFVYWPIWFSQLLAAPEYSALDQGISAGSEYSIFTSFGYRGFYLVFNAAGGSGIDPLYTGESIRGTAFYNVNSSSIKVEYIRSKNSYSVSSWPPNGASLNTFVGKKIK